MSGPIFKPNETVWHVRHGKVTLESCNYRGASLRTVTYGAYCLEDGRQQDCDVGRVLYTLAEAEQYGWYKPEPRVVEFEEAILDFHDGSRGVSIALPADWQIGKRVRVTVTEIQE